MYIHKIEKDTYCPTEFGVNIFGNKWKPRILCLFSIKGTLRYKEIKASIPGITDNVLASTLRDLIAAELVTRVQYNEMPLRVEYSLSEKGESLIPVLRHICYWAITAYGQEVKGTAKTCPYAAQRENQKTE